MVILKKLSFFVIIALLLNSCDILEQINEAERFAQCNFSISGVQLLDIAGVDISHIKSQSDINVGEMLTIGGALANGKLPTTLNVNINAYNPNTKNAAISGIDWEVYMKETKYASGKINKRIDILPGQSASFPLKVQFDLLNIFSSNSLNDILAFISDGSKENLKKLDIKARIKPWYKVGGQIKPAPAAITIRP
jgi:LEA14-like dessication related protein